MAIARQVKIRVLLADDQVLFVESLKYILEGRSADIEVVGIAHDGEEAVEMAGRLQPDIILMDVRMPELDGVQATRFILEKQRHVRVVMLTTFSDDDYVKTAIQFGAVGYLLKNIPPDELIKSLQLVKGGIMQISPGVARNLMARGENPADLQDDRPVLLEPLTRREKEVLKLITQAYDNRQIAAYLGVAEQTARNYVHNLYSRLGVSNRMQLIRLMSGAQKDGQRDDEKREG